MSHPTTRSGPAYTLTPTFHSITREPTHPYDAHATTTAHGFPTLQFGADCATLFVIREEEAAKKAEAARKKAEREALLAEEEKNTPGRSAPKNAKSAQKKTRGIDDALGGLDGGEPAEGRKLATLNASGLDNALDALAITNSDNKLKIDRHPERRVATAKKDWVDKRMKELTDEGFFKIKGNTKPNMEFKLRKEFDKRPENPMNQVHGTYNMTQEEMAEIRAQEEAKTEKLLAED